VRGLKTFLLSDIEGKNNCGTSINVLNVPILPEREIDKIIVPADPVVLKGFERRQVNGRKKVEG
jgi:hypothetical protein